VDCSCTTSSADCFSSSSREGDGTSCQPAANAARPLDPAAINRQRAVRLIQLSKETYGEALTFLKRLHQECGQR